MTSQEALKLRESIRKRAASALSWLIDPAEDRQPKQRAAERALALLEECAEYGFAPPRKLIELLSACLRDPGRINVPSAEEWRAAGVNPGGSAYHQQMLCMYYGVGSPHSLLKLHKAARFEAGQPNASVNQTATASGADRATIREWRLRNPRYCELIDRLRSESETS